MLLMSLKTPLTIISGFIETIKLGHVQEKAQLSRILDIIELETKRLNKLVNNLLHLSHLEKNISQGDKKIHRLSLFKIIPQIKDLYQPLLEEKSIILDMNIADNLLQSPISEEFLYIVLGNLLENAIKYSKPQSKIILSSEIRNSNFYLKLQDFGCGIPEEEQEKIFQRFYRVDPSRNSKIKGNGLGLSIVKKMIENVNGNISVESIFGKGSTFFISIPISQRS
ncbi:Sensor histidine kinase YycG [Fusobacterium necrophorum subsp. necrophorum]|nr:Sensor histidine kinase YycG [Fusobacterium necrophorum subsp. necrophorum]